MSVTTMRSDAALLAAARTDAGAFRELYDRYAERVLGYHLRRTRDEDAAHDLTAETFAQGHGRADRRRHQARQRRLSLAALGRPRVGVLHRPRRRRPADHRRRLPRRVRP
jgi:DNA-directed RNA polymerase specialized sigma24 family protein